MIFCPAHSTTRDKQPGIPLLDPARLNSRFLEGLSPDALDDVLGAATLRWFAARSIVTYQDDIGDHLYLLIQGVARYFATTEDGNKLILVWLKRGDIFGGASLLLHPPKYLVSTEILRDSRVAVWKRNTIRRLAQRYPRILENALSIATDYLSWYVASHSALVSGTARQRLARVLASLAAGIGHNFPGGIELRVTNEELANAANVTHFTASRLMSAWHRNGAIDKRRGIVIISNQHKLV